MNLKILALILIIKIFNADIVKEPDSNILRALLELNVQDVEESLKRSADPNLIPTLSTCLSLKLSNISCDIIPNVPLIHMTIGGGSERHFQIATLLLDYGADPNTHGPHFPPAILYALGFSKAPSDGMAATIHRILSNKKYRGKFNLGGSLLSWNRQRGYLHEPTLLSYAVLKNFAKGVVTLIKDGKVDVNEADIYGVTPLHLAAWMGFSEVGAILLSNHADVTATDRGGKTPLHYAGCRGHFQFLQLFTDSALLSLHVSATRRLVIDKDAYGQSALDIAASFPHLSNISRELVQYLRSAGAMDEQEANHIMVTEMKPLKRRGAQPLLSKDYGWECVSYPSLIDSRVNTIETVHISELSKARFVQRYLSALRPVLITGNMTGRGKPWGIWQHMERSRFVERYGGLRVDTGIIPYAQSYNRGNESRLGVPLASWLEEMAHQERTRAQRTDTCRSGGGSEVGGDCGEDNRNGAWIAFEDSVADQLPEVFAEDVSKPFFAACCDGFSDMGTRGLQLSVGGYSSGAPLHAHNSAWNLLLAGRKRWFLLPPGVLVTKEDMWGHSAHPLSAMEELEAMSARGLAYEVTQYPGDVLFVPYGWGHATINQCETVALAQEFCAPLTDPNIPPPVALLMHQETQDSDREDL